MAKKFVKDQKVRLRSKPSVTGVIISAETNGQYMVKLIGYANNTLRFTDELEGIVQRPKGSEWVGQRFYLYNDGSTWSKTWFKAIDWYEDDKLIIAFREEDKIVVVIPEGSAIIDGINV